VPVKLTGIQKERARRCDLCNCAHPAREGDCWIYKQPGFLVDTYRFLTCQNGRVRLRPCPLRFPNAAFSPLEASGACYMRKRPCRRQCTFNSCSWPHAMQQAAALRAILHTPECLDYRGDPVFTQVWDITDWGYTMGILPQRQDQANTHKWVFSPSPSA